MFSGHEPHLSVFCVGGQSGPDISLKFSKQVFISASDTDLRIAETSRSPLFCQFIDGPVSFTRNEMTNMWLYACGTGN